MQFLEFANRVNDKQIFRNEPAPMVEIEIDFRDEKRIQDIHRVSGLHALQFHMDLNSGKEFVYLVDSDGSIFIYRTEDIREVRIFAAKDSD